MHSQNREEEVILKYYPSWFKGTILDLGANDGITLSNSYELIQRGWTGVLVEPDPIAFSNLQHLYREKENVKCWQTAIGTEDGKADFYSSGVHLGVGDNGLLSSLKMEELGRFPGTDFKTIQVNVYTWNTFLEKSGQKTFDAISIDCEGMDLDILKQIDLKATKTSLVIVEWNGSNENAYSIVCGAAGMKLIHKNGENLIFAL